MDDLNVRWLMSLISCEFDSSDISKLNMMENSGNSFLSLIGDGQICLRDEIETHPVLSVILVSQNSHFKH